MLKRLLAFITLTACAIPQGLMAHSIYARIGKAYLDPVALSEDSRPVSSEAEAKDAMRRLLTEERKKVTTLQLFHGAEQEQESTQKFIEPVTWKDLEILNLMPEIDRTSTVFGRVELLRRLVDDRPVTDLQELERRQHVVKTLIENPHLLHTLDTSLKSIHEAESVLLKFFLDKSTTRSLALNAWVYMDRTVPTMMASMLPDNEATRELIASMHNMCDSYDTSPTMLVAGGISDKLLMLGSLMMLAWDIKDLFPSKKPENAIPYGPLTYQETINQQKASLLTEKIVMESIRANNLVSRDAQREYAKAKIGNRRGSLPGTSQELQAVRGEQITQPNPSLTLTIPLEQAQNLGMPLPQNYSSWTAAKIGLSISAGLYLLRKVYLAHRSLSTWLTEKPKIPFVVAQKLKNDRDVQLIVQEDLIKLAQAVEDMRRTTGELVHSTNLEQLVPEAASFFNFFLRPHTHSAATENLFTLLNSSTFKGEPSIFSHFGNIYAANKLMDMGKKDWVAVFKAIGQLDVYVSTAKLILESRTKRVGYTFATFTNAQKPYISLKGFWNPLVGAETAVANSVKLGRHSARSMILTGPNTGGKSTVVRGIAISVVLAQTLGIAPAQEAVLTPFTCINTSMNVADDPAKKLSGFDAEVTHAQSLVKKVNTLQPQEFCFNFCDELFRATSPDQAAEASKDYAQLLAQDNCLGVMATHFHELTQLAQTQPAIFENYKIDIDELPDGALRRNYLLSKGISSQKCAAKIIEERRKQLAKMGV